MKKWYYIVNTDHYAVPTGTVLCFYYGERDWIPIVMFSSRTNGWWDVSYNYGSKFPYGKTRVATPHKLIQIIFGEYHEA